MDYLKFYDLASEPFQNDPDERFFFESATVKRAEMRLQRAVEQRKGLAVLTGDSGCGKTMLGQRLFEGLDREQWAPRWLSISHATCASGWLLPHVAAAFGEPEPAATPPAQVEQVEACLLALLSESTHPVLIIDEAQMLRSAEVMQEFRSLLNLTHEGRRMLSIVLLGLADLAAVIDLDASLAQRVDMRVELVQLSSEEVARYVAHRLEVAGTSDRLFNADALAALATYSNGIPRVLNTLADNALFEGFVNQAKTIDASIVAEAADELALIPLAPLEITSPANYSLSDEPPCELMDCSVPPAETGFSQRAEAPDLEPMPVIDYEGGTSAAQLSEEAPDIQVIDVLRAKLGPGDFSMGSAVRAVDAPSFAEPNSTHVGELSEDWDIEAQLDGGPPLEDAAQPGWEEDEGFDMTSIDDAAEPTADESLEDGGDPAADFEFEALVEQDTEAAAAAAPDIDEQTGPDSDCALSAESAVSRAEEDIDALFDDIRVAD